MNLAIIPARSGSKRIPNKNIKLFNGKPLISFSIEKAIKSKIFDEIIVSTDSKKIATISEKYGAKIPFIRPKNLSDDKTRITKVIKHALLWFKERNYAIDYACCIYATNPLLDIKYLKKGYNELIKSKKNFSLSVCKYNHPIQRALTINNKGNLNSINPIKISKRTQDLKDYYFDAGQFIWGTNNAFINLLEPLSKHSKPIIIPSYKTCDVDDLDDFRTAEKYYLLNKNL